ncbi:MAG: hypothetical protein A2521_07250 [Deltaproteobacteria bacterium RIFOXYD12_FULL_57_12]|nr:MAG: hypothetical protein A2521_07250 [Deltaproteobacteria bacterium RIFOXYD12_FULL_57_12]
MKKGLFLLLIISFIALCVYLFMVFYDTAEKTAIRQLNAEQQIHAQQASHGIEDFFKTWTGILSSFSKMDEIISVDEDGKRYMALFYEAHQEQIRSITRVDEKGRILHTVPHSDSIGSDISGQKHVRDILRDHKPVVSDVFWAVQGFEGIALHVPVFKGTTFKGTIAIVIDFENLARRYLEVIKIGQTGYAWVVSRDGTTLYSPVPGFTGKAIFDNFKDYPAILSMTKEMLQGHQGTTTYTIDRIGDKTVAPVKKYAVYLPINIANTFWSIVVASSEDEILSSLASFRNRLLLVIGMILFGGILFTIISAKAWLIVAEEEKRKKAEEELRESEQYNRLLFELSPVGLALCRLDGSLVDVNSAYANIIGRSVEETLALTYWNITPPQYTAQEQAQLDSLRATGRYGPYEKEYTHKDGHLVPVRLSGLIFERGGEKLIWSSVEDITDRKAAEAELQKTTRKREELESIINRSQAVVFLWRAAAGWPVEYVSENVRQWGYTPEDFIDGQVSYAGVIHKDDLERVGAEVLSCSESGVTEFRQEYRVITKTGDILWTDDTTWIRRDQMGAITHYQGIVLDVSERKRAEAVLQRNEKLLRLFVEHSPAAIAMFDRDMKYIVASNRFRLDYDLGDQNIIGRSHYEVFPDIPEHWREIHRRCLAGAVEKSENDPFPRAGGKTDWVRWEIHPWYEAEGELGGIILFSEVITEQKQIESDLMQHRDHLEELVEDRTTALKDSQSALVNLLEDMNEAKMELEAANEKLKELDRLKSMFIASMSHELRTPLNSIIGFTGIMLQGMTGEITTEQRDHIQRVFRAGKHLLSLITDVIDIAKIESGKITPYAEEFLLKDVIDEACASLQVQMSDKGLGLVKKVPETPINMNTDRRRLLQCLLNYLSNAVKFSEKGKVVIEVTEWQSGKVTEKGTEVLFNTPLRGTQRQKAFMPYRVQREREGNVPEGWVEISVTDTGIGIRAEDMELLFGSFVRLESHLKTTTPGTGLGLYLTKKLATEVLGGEVGAESEAGRGSRFWLRVPVCLSDRGKVAE